MNRATAILLLSLVVPSLAWATDAATAAAKFIPNVKWQPKSIVVGDFSCRGRTESAVLGTSKREIVVAIFLGTLTARPTLLRYSATARDPLTAELTIEDLDFELKQFESEVGYIPDGLRPSKKCKGLNLSDGKVDSAHIYWSHSAKKFADWAL